MQVLRLLAYQSGAWIRHDLTMSESGFCPLKSQIKFEQDLSISLS